MVTSRDLELEGKHLEKEIDQLRQDWHELNVGLHYTRGRIPMSAMIGPYLLKRDLERQIYQLRLRHNMVQNSYVQLRQDEARRIER